MEHRQSLPMQPPHSIEAEMSVLGGLMLKNDMLAEVARVVSADDFYRLDHRVIFQAITDMIGARKECDWVTVTAHLKNTRQIEEVGGAEYLASLVTDTYSIVNCRSYADIIRERSVLRGLIAVGATIGEMGFKPERSAADELLERAERMVYDLRQARRTRSDNGLRPLSDFVTEAEYEVDRLHKIGGGMGGISTGFSWLDSHLDGLHPGDLIVLAGRPGTGKSTLAMNIAMNVATAEGGARADVFSMEMQGKQLALRMLADTGRVNLQALRAGRLNDADWDRLTSASALVRHSRIQIDETGALSPMDLRTRVRRSAARGGLGLVVVDYIQLMSVAGSRENRTNQVSEISRSLKALAKEFNVPVIALSQLSRAPEKETRKPRLSDLRESGGIEQDADAVLFVHRPDEGEPDATAGIKTAEIICAKQRQGPTGSHRMKFEGAYSRFLELSHQDEIDLADQASAKVAATTRGFGRLRDDKRDAKRAAAGDA